MEGIPLLILNVLFLQLNISVNSQYKQFAVVCVGGSG